MANADNSNQQLEPSSSTAYVHSLSALLYSVMCKKEKKKNEQNIKAPNETYTQWELLTDTGNTHAYAT